MTASKVFQQGFIVVLSLLISGLSLTALSYYHIQKDKGIVLATKSPLHVAPTSSSPVTTYLQQGFEAKVLKENEAYYFVSSKKNEEGWISKTLFDRVWL